MDSSNYGLNALAELADMALSEQVQPMDPGPFNEPLFEPNYPTFTQSPTPTMRQGPIPGTGKFRVQPTQQNYNFAPSTPYNPPIIQLYTQSPTSYQSIPPTLSHNHARYAPPPGPPPLPPPPPETPRPQTPPRLSSKRAPSVSPQKPAPKRAAMQDSRKAKAETKKRAQEEKVLSVLAEQDPLVNALAFRWADEDMAAVFTFLLGPESDKNFEHVKDRLGNKYIFTKVVKHCVLQTTRTYGAVKSFWTRSFVTYTALVALEGFTGGGGDGDLDGDSESDIITGYTNKIAAAKKKGIDLGSLDGKTAKKWHEKGWFTLFSDRFSSSSRIERKVVYSSATITVSDSDDSVSDDDDDDILSSSPIKQTKSKKTTKKPLKVKKDKKPASHVVSEPKHTPPSKPSPASINTADTIRSLHEFLSIKAEAAKIKAADHATDAELARLEKILSMPNLSGDAIATANERVLEILKRGTVN